jgi:GDP-L-fucose synthase
MSDFRILLTGGTGMVGRNLLEHPSLADLEVLAPSSQELNLCDFSSVLSYIERHKPEMVIHCAGKVGGIQANIRKPLEFLTDNLDMGRNIVLAARQKGVKRLINLGCSCMYPRNQSAPLCEEMVLKGELEPTNEGNALAKIVVARMCDYIRQEDESFKFKTLIPCNLYGHHDKFDPTHSHLIPSIIYKIHQAMQCGHSNVEIWGDGTARREFMYAGDLADVLVRAITHFDSLPNYMNIGLGHDHSVNDYYQIAAQVMGYNGSFTHDTSKPVGMARKLVNISRQLAWGWSSQNDLFEGISKTYNFYRKENKL